MIMENTEYHIKLSDIQTLKKIIESQNTDGKFDVDIIRIDILIDKLMNNFKSSEKTSLIKSLKNSASYQEEFNGVYPYLRTFCKTGIYFEDVPQFSYKNVYLSHDDAVDIAGDFYSKHGEFFYGAFQSFYKDRHSHLEFIKPNNNTDGEIVTFEATKDTFVFSPDYPNFTKATILIHELEHVIDCYRNPNFYQNTIIREAIALFMEMIGSEYVYKVLDLKNNEDVKRRLHLHAIVKTDAYLLYIKNQILYLINNKISNNAKIMRALTCDYGYSKDLVKMLGETSLVQDYYYLISQLIAIELYALYKKDKEYALSIARTIILKGNDDNIFTLLNQFGIRLNSNLFDYEYDMALKLEL